MNDINQSEAFFERFIAIRNPFVNWVERSVTRSQEHRLKGRNGKGGEILNKNQYQKKLIQA
jgi:hypothetical protein